MLLLPNFQGHEEKVSQGPRRKCQGTENVFSLKTVPAQMKIYYSQPAEGTKENKNNVHTITTPRHKEKKKKNRKK